MATCHCDGPPHTYDPAWCGVGTGDNGKPIAGSVLDDVSALLYPLAGGALDRVRRRPVNAQEDAAAYALVRGGADGGAVRVPVGKALPGSSQHCTGRHCAEHYRGERA